MAPDTQRLATGSSDGKVNLWRPTTGAKVLRLARPTRVQLQDDNPPNPTSLAFTHDGGALAAAWADGAVIVWDAATGKAQRRRGGSVGRSYLLAFAPGGDTLATLGSDGVPRLWDVARGLHIRRLPPQKEQAQREGIAITALAFSPDGRTLAIGEGGNNANFLKRRVAGIRYTPSVQLWEPAAARKRGQIILKGFYATLEGDDGLTWGDFGGLIQPVGSLTFSPDGRVLAVGCGGTVRLWGLAEGRVAPLLEVDFLPRSAASAFSPDGKMLALGGPDAFFVWNVGTGKQLSRVAAHRGRVLSLAFSPDGKLLATGGADGDARLWDVRTLLAAHSSRTGTATPAALEAMWADLAGADAERADRAQWTLADLPDAVPFLLKRVRPAPPADAARIGRLVRELGSDSFAARSAAMRELEKLADAAEPALRRALEGEPPLEVRRRVEQLLDTLGGSVPGPDELRSLRVVEVLERAGTEEARRGLRELAGGAPEARLTREARSALSRLARRLMVSAKRPGPESGSTDE